MQVKRYNVSGEGACYEINEDIEGEFVKASDYDALKAEIAALGASGLVAGVRTAGQITGLKQAAALALEGCFDIGCTALEAEGVVRRTREAIAAELEAKAKELKQ